MSLDDYNAGQMTYDLRRLRLRGLIEWIPHSQRYRLTAEGLCIALAYHRTQARVLGPVLSATLDGEPSPASWWPHYRRSSSGSAPCAGRPWAATGTAVATGASSSARRRRARRPRDELRAPPTRRKRPAATFTEAATTTDAPAPGRPPLRRSRRDIDREADRRRLDAELAAARRRRTEHSTTRTRPSRPSISDVDRRRDKMRRHAPRTRRRRCGAWASMAPRPVNPASPLIFTACAAAGRSGRTEPAASSFSSTCRSGGTRGSAETQRPGVVAITSSHSRTTDTGWSRNRKMCSRDAKEAQKVTYCRSTTLCLWRTVTT